MDSKSKNKVYGYIEIVNNVYPDTNKPTRQIHHIDKDHSNNAISNLYPCDSIDSHHSFHYVMEHDFELYKFIMYSGKFLNKN